MTEEEHDHELGDSGLPITYVRSPNDESPEEEHRDRLMEIHGKLKIVHNSIKGFDRPERQKILDIVHKIEEWLK